MTIDQSNGENPWEILKQDIDQEIKKTVGELQEISLMHEQSKIEVNRLAQKNASITSRIQQMQSQFDTFPRDDIRTVYDEALDSQQRLFVMRGQLEKLQSDQTHLAHYRGYLERVAEVLDSDVPSKSQKSSTGDITTIEAIIQAQEAERQRLSRQMHDGPAQALSNFILQTEIAVRLFDIDQEKAREELANLKESATSTFQKVRDFVFELRPMMLDDLGLVPTLKRYTEAFKEQTSTNTTLSVTGVERRFESYIEVIIFRAIQELLGFAFRQSQASEIKVQMDIADNFIKILVDDNGRGLDVDTVFEGSGMGIKVIKERVEMLGGFLEIDSQIGSGCQVSFQVPAGVSGQSVFA